MTAPSEGVGQCVTGGDPLASAGEEATNEPADDAADHAKAASALSASPTLWLTRGAVLRALGFVDAVAFWSLYRQMDGLIGSHGLLPAARYLDRIRQVRGGVPFLDVPTLFWLSCSDATLHAACLLGFGLSLAVVAGLGNAPILLSIWLLYLSFVHIGQVFYGYGWELLLLEAGFLGTFLAPAWGWARTTRSPPPRLVVWLFRWLCFRVMLGAGLIKLRGDPCWRDLTCLVYHFETQPNPSPLSYYFNELPLFADKVGVLFNHFVELVAPFGLLGPRRLRHVAGGVIVVFQAVLILSGNLSFLNWLTIAVALSAFDDSFFERWLPRSIERRWRERERGAKPESTLRRRVIVGLTVVIGTLSIFPVVNMISPGQVMNRSFDPFALVNTYGAFGSVGRERHEVVLEGTRDDPDSPSARWLEYEFPCKPGDVKRAPCLVTPYHYRLDWQMWFAGLSNFRREPWIVKLVYELLRENPAVTALLAKDPFAGHPPRAIRAVLYRYRFARDHKDGWWERERLGEYLPPLTRDDPGMLEFLARRGWLPG